MSKRSQAESESPAKMYQLDAVENKVDQVIGQLKVVIDNTSGLVTQLQLEEARRDFKDIIVELEADFDDKLDTQKNQVDLKYGPVLRQNKALWALVGTAVVAIIVQAIIIVSLRG